MDRNTVLGIILIGVILIGYSIFTKPSDEQVREMQRVADSIHIAEQMKAIEAQKAKNADSSRNNLLTSAQRINSDSSNKALITDEYGVFANAATGNNEFYTIENDLVKITLSSKGGRPYSVQLKKYSTADSQPVILFKGDSTQFGFNFYANNRSISTGNLYFIPTTEVKNVSLLETDSVKTLALRVTIAEGKYIEYVYRLAAKQYMVNLYVNLIGLNDVIAQNTSTLDLTWKIYARTQEKEAKSENGHTALYYKHFGDEEEPEEFSASTTPEEEQKSVATKLKWIGYKQQFFSTVIIAEKGFTNGAMKSITLTDDNKYLKIFNSELGLPYENKDNQTIALQFYFGPNHFQTLKKYEMGLESLVSLGSWIVKWINRFFIIPIFNFLHQYILNFGIIILILTIIIKIILHPLTAKSYKSMAKMRVLKPQIDEINEKIPADKPMERQQATMALYKKAGVNPLGGCLPMLLQLPILIAMFKFFPTSIELRQQGFLWATDLSTYDSIFSWSTHIPLVSDYFGNHISLFNILMTITTIITIKMSSSTQSNTQMPGMQFISYLMPVMFMFVLNSFSAALTYYYFLTNVITIVQNEIMRRSIDETALLAQLNEHKKKPVKKSKFQEKLEQAAKKRGYKM